MTMRPEAWLGTLWQAHTGFTVGLLAVLLLRRPWRRLAGAQAAYALWLLPLWLALAALLPSTGLPTLMLPAVYVSALAGLPAPNATGSWHNGWLALWLAGVVTVALVQTARHRRYLGQLLGRDQTAWQAPAGDSPGLLGVWRPRLVLPVDFLQRFDADERRWIVAHEATHARRLDNLARLLAAMLAGLAWFNPLAWFALAALRQDQELACDAAVMQRYPGSWRRYGLALLKLDGANSLPPAASAWQSHHPLKERIMLLKEVAPSVRARHAARVALVLSALLGFGAVQALNAGSPGAASAARPTARHSELSDLTALPSRVKLIESCPQMPRPEIPPELNDLKGQYQLEARFRIGADGHPETVKVQGDPRLVDMIEKTVRA
jgi:beta-lactamase regulating signal transducer with metallopeptidase domain